jgi:hypothetical protein
MPPFQRPSPTTDMLLVLSHSEDITTDIVLNHLKDLDVFRFNIDLWQDYEWFVDRNTFLLRDPTHRSCRDEEVHAVYLRKLFFNPPLIDVPAGGSEEAWTRAEVEALWLGLRDLAMETQRLALVHPSPYGRWNKIRQMRVASRFFRVPEWSAFHSHACPMAAPIVAKSFGQSHIGKGGILMVRQVDPEKLSPKYPWFVQKCVSEATHDVTVACIGGKLFAYELPRSSFDGQDCRFSTTLEDLAWTPCHLSPAEANAVRRFMQATGLTYGRIDMLRDSEGLWFLEVNPNGQFAWLDPHGKNGLLDAVADEIRQVHHRQKASRLAIRTAVSCI